MTRAAYRRRQLWLLLKVREVRIVSTQKERFLERIMSDALEDHHVAVGIGGQTVPGNEFSFC